MKRICILAVIAASTILTVSAETAYEGLQALRKSKGDEVLSKLIEVRGETGQPQPQQWTILMIDSEARGGIREFVVSAGVVLSERTPLRRSAPLDVTRPLNFSRLNLDSDGAFKIAEKQAMDRKVGFNAVDYTLEPSPTSESPIWVLRLSDYMGAPVGTLTISAENGEVINALRMDPDARQTAAPRPTATPRSTATPQRAAAATPVPESTPRFKGGVFGFFERAGRTIGTTARDASITVAGTVEEVLTGERTLGREPVASPTPTP